MAVPTPSELIRPILEYLSTVSSHVSNQKIGKEVAGLLKLSEDDVNEMSAPLQGKTRFKANLDSTLITLKGASLLEGPHGNHRITNEGKEFLRSRPGEITRREVVALWEQQRDDKEDFPASVMDDEKIPEEQIADVYNQWRDELAIDLRNRIKGIKKPGDFEKLVAELLVKMGYGRGEVVGGPGDRGVDAIMTQDRLGLEKVLVQVKHYKTSSVPPKDIREFNDVSKGHKGVFVTSSTFSPAAKEEAKSNYELIDGPKLIDLMIEYDLGLIKKATYEIREVDENFHLFKQDKESDEGPADD